MIRLRQRHPVFGRGNIEFLSPDNEQVLAYLREGEGETIVVVANLSRHSQFAELDLDRFTGQRPTEMLGRTEFPVVGDTLYPLSLGPYGFYWLSIGGHDPSAVDPRDVVEISGPLEGAFASDGPLPEILGRFVAAQSWHQGRPPRRSQISVADLIPITPGEQDTTMWIALVAIGGRADSHDLNVVPIGISFAADPDIAESAVLAHVRRDGADGVLFDAVENPQFRAMLLEGILAGETLLGRAGSLTCTAGTAMSDIPTGGPIESTVSTNSRGETYIDFQSGFVIKLFRQVEPGVNPDLELRRFLTERTAFNDIADTYGALEYQSGDTYTLGVLQQSFAEDSTAWNVLTGFARSWLDATATRKRPVNPMVHSDG